MVASRSGRWMSLRLLGAAVLATAVACTAGLMPSSHESATTHRLTDVRVDSGDSGSIVTLSGLADPIYTAFLQSEPRALVLDLMSVEIATENDLVMVYDGLVENVTLSTFGSGSGEPLTRIEVGLAQDASYEIVSTPDGLLAVLSAVEVTAEPDVQAEVADEMATNAEARSLLERHHLDDFPECFPRSLNTPTGTDVIEYQGSRQVLAQSVHMCLYPDCLKSNRMYSRAPLSWGLSRPRPALTEFGLDAVAAS